MKKMCRRVWITVLALVLCLEMTLPVTAVPSDNIMSKTGVEVQNVTGGMQPFDMSEEAIAASQVSVEEFMEKHGMSEEDLANSERQMLEELGLLSGNATEVGRETSLSVNSAEVSAERASYGTIEDAAAYLRGKMVARKEEVSIRVASSKDTAMKDVRKILAKVYEYDENGSPKEGDYLYWHSYYMEWTDPQKNSDGTYTIHFWFYYRTTAEEEKYVDKKVKSIISNLNLKSSSLSEYQKVRAIYDYIMKIIEYDYYHYEYDQSYMPMYTAYEALNSGYAVCQAYATLFYRLCEEVDIKARVICGIDDANGSPTHGWNIVKIGNDYYNLDATWDDGDVPTHIYFLKNMNDFTDHQRNAMNDGAAFDKQFPMAKVSYPIPEADVKTSMINKENVSGAVRLIDGTMYSLAANGKPKIIFFMNPADCSFSWIESFLSLEAVQSGQCDALFVDIFDNYAAYESQGVTPETVMQIVMEAAARPYLYHFSSDFETGLAYKNQYSNLAGMPTGCYSSFVIVDANNRLRFFGEASGVAVYADKVFEELNYKAAYGTVNGINASQTNNNKVKVSWSAYSGANGYRVYRKMGNGAYCCVGTTSSTSFKDEVKPKSTYTYQVRALYGAKEIASSAEKAITTKTMLLKKGKTYKVDGCKYKVLKSASSAKTVAFVGVSNKKLKKVMIPAYVTIDGMKYKVTEIGAKALKGNKKVKTVSIGENVTKIGKQAFYKASKLNNIVVKTKKLKSVGKQSLKGIAAKAEIRVPSSKYSKYKKLFKGKGQKSTVKIKK